MENNLLKEIAYDIKVSSVMNKNVLSISGDSKMGDLREIMRDRRISGMPVVENNELIGIITLEDFIKAIINREENILIKEKMSRDVKVLFEEEALINALNKFEKFNYGRFPVINNNKKLVGILTKTDVIHGFLKTLENKYQEEEIKGYRVSHFFEDVLADKKEIILEYEIMGGDFKIAGRGSSRLKKTLKRLGIHPNIIRRLAIASYEAEMNVVIYAKRGTIKAFVFQDRIDVDVDDEGPGIPDVEKAMEPGFSTAPDWVRELGFGAGMGLYNIKNCSDAFEIKSEVGLGTSLIFRVNIN
ncbi:MAG: CBS domain-containing protein [bacterium]